MARTELTKWIEQHSGINSQSYKADAGKPRLSLVPEQILIDIARVREHGTAKYGDAENWREVELGRYIDALLRHVWAFAHDIRGVDAESGLEHYKHAACNLAFICEVLANENV